MRISRDSLAAALVLATGLLALALNHDQPLVRNSLVYARATEHVIAAGFDPLPVVADSRLSYDKPIGFAWTSAPLVAVFGTHRGLMLSSALGTALLLAAALQLLRTVLPGEANERLRARALLFGALSPLVVYQTWSAHPDAIEAALQLAVLTQLFRITDEPSRAPLRRAAWLFVLLEAGFLFKNYGLVMLAVIPLAFGARLVGTWRRGGRRTVLGVASAWLAVAALAGLAALDWNPLHRLSGEGGGAGQYGQGELLHSAIGCVLAVCLALALCLQIVLPFAASSRPGTRGLWPLVAFACVHVAGLLPFANAYYNLRYFVPLLPVAGLLAALGLERAPAALRRAVPVAFVAIALATTVVFDVAPVYELAQPWLPAWRLRGEQMPGMLDNLRLPLHLEQRRWLADLDAATPRGATVYLIDFAYYGDAQHGVYERAGLIRADLTTRYVSRRRFAPAEPEIFACFWHSPDRALLAKLGDVDEPRPGIFRVRRH